MYRQGFGELTPKEAAFASIAGDEFPAVPEPVDRINFQDSSNKSADESANSEDEEWANIGAEAGLIDIPQTDVKSKVLDCLDEIAAAKFARSQLLIREENAISKLRCVLKDSDVDTFIEALRSEQQDERTMNCGQMQRVTRHPDDIRPERNNDGLYYCPVADCDFVKKVCQQWTVTL